MSDDLYRAIEAGEVRAVESFLKERFLVNLVYTKTRLQTPLHQAAFNGNVEIVNLLLDHGAKQDVRNNHGETPLQMALKNDKIDTIKILIDNGAELAVKDRNNVTSLHWASIHGRQELVELLLKVDKIDVNECDYSGCSPLHRASEYGQEDIVQILVSNGANVLGSDKKGWTALHYAASCNRLDVVKMLAAHMVDVDVVDRDGFTPFHIAASWGYPAVVQELLIIGAGVDMKTTSTCQTPYELAEEHGHSTVTEILKDHLADGLPMEIKLLDSTLADGFERSLRWGFYYSYVGKIMFVGNESVGKTAITRLILGKKPKRKRKPTEGIDIHIHRAAIDRELRKLIPKALKSEDTAYSNLFMRKSDCVKPPKDDIQNDIEPIEDAADNPDNLLHCFEIPEDQNDENQDDGEAPLPLLSQPTMKTMSLKNLFFPKKRKPKATKSSARKMFRAGAKTAGLKGIHKMRLAPVIILDFAGQEVFYSTHQSFLTHRGVYVIVINGSLDFDDKIESEMFIPGRQGEPTTRGYIKFWVNSILCYSSGKSQAFPKIVICCTHKDKINKGLIEEQRKYIFDEIDSMFSTSSASSHLVTRERIFINAIDAKDPEIEILKTVIVDVIFSQPTWGEKMPKSWIHLEMAIAQKVKDGKHILKLKKLRKMNKLNPVKVLNQEEMNIFLQIHHSVGNLVYFPMPGLRDYVIISPSFLIDALKMIVTDKRFVKANRLDMWRFLNAEGKLRRTDLLKIFGNHPDFSKYKEFLINVMCHLDMLTEPRVYDPQKGCIIRSDFFYVPSMVKGGSGEIFSDQSVLTNSFGFSFKFTTAMLPSAIGFRLIASCLDLWKVGQYEGKNLLFSGMVVVVVNKYVRLIVKAKDDRIDIFLTHTTSRFDIKASTATSIRECLTDILQRITDSYKILSAGTSDHATSSFQIEYTCYNVISPCYCKERIEWTCSHGNRISTNILNKFFADKTIKDIDCPTDCKGVDVDMLQLQPTELHLAKLSLLIDWENLKAILLHLGVVMAEIIEIEEDYKGIRNIKFLCLRKWRMKTPSCTIGKIYSAIEKESQDLHILCKVFRDIPLESNVPYDNLEKIPKDIDFDPIAKVVIEESLLFCVHLGIHASVWLQMKADGHKIVEINRCLLRQWRDEHRGKPKLRELAEALCNVGMSIDILLADAS